ncbi:hypothetical protein PR202_ga10169 [Eleusine coracana subsp. coracana]|uniref:Tyrosine-protein kinase catalytic domain-containing protein n=1 Tax=Eleusine coracana subsp. coracana TaxID=191504 RepID=A0AAV5C636_ELECO|nr:hypothetical protein PR202_ga10169 [Eleusine coracana subsp. coracana]
MDETPTSSGQSEASSCEPSWWPPDFMEKVESASISRKHEVLGAIRSSSWKASQLLWSTGTYSGLIPNGFYSIIPDKKLKETFPTIPSLDDLQTLEADGLKADIIIVDTERDKKVFMLKQLSGALVKGLNSSPALVIKKIAGLVFDCFKRQNPDASPGKRIESSSNLSGRSLRQHDVEIKNVFRGKIKVCNACKICSVSVFSSFFFPWCSPEHPLMRARGRSILGGEKNSFQEYAENAVASRSEGLGGSSTPNTRRIRRRSISITPEIGDDIVRAVRAMNETLKQNRLQRDDVEGSCSYDTEGQNNVNVCPDNIYCLQDGATPRGAVTNNGSRNQIGPTQKAMSLPSSPHEYRGQITEKTDGYISKEKLALKWNKVLQSSSFLNKPLLPFEEWNIDFSEITIGTRVGIGKDGSLFIVYGGNRYRYICEHARFFGEVFRGIWNGTDVAIKVFLEQDLTTENMEDFCNEIYILSRLRHPNAPLLAPRNGWPLSLLGMNLSQRSVIYFSLGVIMWELCTLSRPWEGISPVQVVYAVANEGSRLEIPEGPLGKLITDCWAETENRPSCQEILTRLLDCEYAIS